MFNRNKIKNISKTRAFNRRVIICVASGLSVFLFLCMAYLNHSQPVGSICDNNLYFICLLIFLLLIILFLYLILFSPSDLQFDQFFVNMVAKKGVKENDTIYDYCELNDLAHMLNNGLREKKENLKNIKFLEEKCKEFETLKSLTGHASHDLNNALSSLISYPDMFLERGNITDEKLKRALLLMKSGGNIAVDIISDLLDLTKESYLEPVVCDLNDLINNSIDDRQIQKLEESSDGIFINKTLEGKLPLVRMTSIHLEKIIMKLVLNGIEATQKTNKTGCVNIRTYSKSINGDKDIKDGHYVIVTVTDTGPVIEKVDIKKIFEPFYIKKVLCRSSSGLSLTITKHLLDINNALISVFSSDLYTDFNLFFPVCDNSSKKRVVDVKNNLSQPHGQNVLVVDDVESQRVIAIWMLEKLGYQGVPVNSGEDAIEFLKKNTVDLILLDLVMSPGIGGDETCREILKIYPSQKIVMMSGFIEKSELGKIFELGVHDYIRKPYTQDILEAVLKRVLE